MDEQETVVVAGREPHPHSPKLGFPLPAGDEKLVTGLSTVLVASIQEAKDRISQIEYVFCSQLYPHFQSIAKLSHDLAAKRRRIEHLEVLLQSKESSVRDAEEKRNAAFAKLESCENERSVLLGRINDLDEKFQMKSREIEVAELKEASYRKLLEQLEESVLSKEFSLRDAEEKRKSVVSKLESCERKINDLDEELRTKSREIEEAESKRVEDEVSYQSLLERVESLRCELQAEKTKRNRITEAYKRLKSQHVYLRRKVGLTAENMVHENKLESGSELAKHQSPIVEPGLAFESPNMVMGVCENSEMKIEVPQEEDFGGLEKETPDVFVALCDTYDVKEVSEDDKGANLRPPSSFRSSGPKCQSSTKLVSISGTKRPASSWRQTRSHQSRAGPDPHDDFLDTPLENIRENLNKDLNKEDLPNLIQKEISVNSSDDETQDMNAKSSPQKKQSSITVANKRSFKYIEPVRKKAERENLKGVECKQCRKFYDAVLPNADGKDADSSKQNFRCEHHDGVSRHRYRYVPPMTPEGFWNIGFESEI
ncbi:hypothetical protein VNO77_39494 [Canavalia gladiata]|uniref:DNA endonuclease activator Ctp1 C-terminal domain-containing protein n=1 Tax=Canavalia gladiata TaxID=3824 RepID=A0AAN9KB67_CANGL